LEPTIVRASITLFITAILIVLVATTNSVQAQVPNHPKTESPSPQGATSRPFAELSTAERLKELERLAPTYDYTCVMHSEVHQAQEGVCPKCGMPLKVLTPSVQGEYKLQVHSTPSRPQAGQKVKLQFIISHPQTGARVKDYVINHEKLFHLFVVSQDLEEYQHLHPQLEPDGSFTVETVLPRTGRYKLHTDFFPVGGTLQVLHRELVTAGKPATRATVTPRADETLAKTVEGTRVQLDWGGKPLTAGVLVPLRYHLADAQTGQPVRDLEPYLGAWGHTLILNADQSEYLHSHPTEMLPDSTHTKPRGGPVVEFRAMFPAAGTYRIWTQFQRSGRIITVAFTIQCQ